jgi:hypothetical protein
MYSTDLISVTVSSWCIAAIVCLTCKLLPLYLLSHPRYEEDIALAKEAHCNAFRLSIEWARVEPQRGVIDQEAVAR